MAAFLCGTVLSVYVDSAHLRQNEEQPLRELKLSRMVVSISGDDRAGSILLSIPEIQKITLSAENPLSERDENNANTAKG
jgi:hypothetical protein